jgi:hypothetical protein
MAMPPTKKRKFGPGKSAVIAADRAATKAQKAPGEEYKAKRAARKASDAERSATSFAGIRRAKQEAAKAKRQDRLSKMKNITAQAKERRKSRSPMPTMGGR